MRIITIGFKVESCFTTKQLHLTLILFFNYGNAWFETQIKKTCLSTIFFMQFFVSATPSTTCCDSISRSVTEGSSASQTAASFCCPSYENRLLASTRTELNAALGMYGSPYAAAAAAAGQNYANYFPYSADPSAIYSSLVRAALYTR